MSTKPLFLLTEPENILEWLRTIPRWVLWRYEPRTKKDGTTKWDKVPYSAAGFRASSTDPGHWSDFQEAETAFLIEDYDGLGIIITGEDFHGIDLDDCRNPDTEELNDLAKEVLKHVKGYAEVSPSGTGIKILARTNLDRSRTRPHIEVYKNNRFFTITANIIEGHDSLSDEPQDIGWLVSGEFDEEISELEIAGDAGALALSNLKLPLEDWGIDRVREEILKHLSPDLPYEEWLSVGMAFHHQGRGDPEWLDLWDIWSSTGSTYVEGECERKWTSFSAQRVSGSGPVTLRRLLKQTRDERAADVINEIDSLLTEIESITEVRELETKIAKKVSASAEISGTDREKLATAIRDKANQLGLTLPIGTIRNWLKPRLSRNFPHLSSEGVPLGTIENTRVLLANMQTTVRYNVISKQLEILIPGRSYTADNQANSTLARVLSEASRAGISTKHILQYVWEIADTNPFNPVATWIDSKPWDGTSRIETFFETIHSSDPKEYKNLVLRKWMTQCIAAAFSPNGIAAQLVLVFQGAQGIGKTRWISSLIPDELRNFILTGFVLETKNKDSLLLATSHWLVEMGEMNSSFARSDHASLKAWITQPFDKIRRPYALTESVYPRRMSLYASINDSEFLIDPTGSRRFIPLAVKKLDFDHGIDLQQLWAEVLFEYRQGASYYLTREEMNLVETCNERFAVADPIEERIAGGYDWSAPEAQWEEATATNVLIRLGISNPTKSQTMAASNAIRRLNGDQFRRTKSARLLRIPRQNIDLDLVTLPAKGDVKVSPDQDDAK
jgi:hypothetical protein